MKKKLIILFVCAAMPGLNAQQVLSLEECRQLALSGNKELEVARQKTVMADYDKKIALANYFPNISASGTYMYNSRNLSLISDEQAAKLSNLGTTVQSKLTGEMTDLMKAFLNDPAAMSSPTWQTLIGKLSKTDVTAALNTLGSGISDALHFNITNVYAGAVSLQQPVFMGGKIIASNKIAKLAGELSQTEYDETRLNIEMEVEKSYWQVVSLAAKDRLAAQYLELLDKLLKDAETGVAEGVTVQSDLLAVKVKHNEAEMLRTRTRNGLALSKMLLCKQLGLPLDSRIKLCDEDAESVPEVNYLVKNELDEVLAKRNDARMLDLAAKIYDKKVNVIRAEMMPRIALTGNYFITNPNMFNGYQNNFGGMFNVGVMVSIPIIHGTEALQKTKKAKVEAAMYHTKYEDACGMIALQVEQLSRNQDEAFERLNMSRNNLDCAEENLRSAMLGFSEGVISSEVAMQAQTAWVKAKTEYIDAGIEVQLNHTQLLKAQGLNF